VSTPEGPPRKESPRFFSEGGSFSAFDQGPTPADPPVHRGTSPFPCFRRATEKKGAGAGVPPPSAQRSASGEEDGGKSPLGLSSPYPRGGKKASRCSEQPGERSTEKRKKKQCLIVLPREKGKRRDGWALRPSHKRESPGPSRGRGGTSGEPAYKRHRRPRQSRERQKVPKKKKKKKKKKKNKTWRKKKSTDWLPSLGHRKGSAAWSSVPNKRGAKNPSNPLLDSPTPRKEGGEGRKFR